MATARVPQLFRLAIVEAHRQMAALVLVGAHLAIGQPQEDALFVERSIAVAESETFGGNIVDSGDTIHSGNHTNPK